MLFSCCCLNKSYSCQRRDRVQVCHVNFRKRPCPGLSREPLRSSSSRTRYSSQAVIHQPWGLGGEGVEEWPWAPSGPMAFSALAGSLPPPSLLPVSYSSGVTLPGQLSLPPRLDLLVSRSPTTLFLSLGAFISICN